MKTSVNFAFLKVHDPLFVELAAAAERSFSSDPNTTLLKLRQLGEALAQHIAVLVGVSFDDRTKQVDLINVLRRELQFELVVDKLFHTLRVEGNIATHQFRTQHREALEGLRAAYTLAIWFHRTFGEDAASFKPGKFIVPTDPSEKLRDLQTELEKLKDELRDANVKLDSNQRYNELIAQEKTEYEELAIAMDEEAQQLGDLVKEHELALSRQQQKYEAKIQVLQKQVKQRDDQAVAQYKQRVSNNSRRASLNVELTEELTRIIIDQHLVDAGWQTDSQEITYKKGARPQKGVNKAIAEWPTEYDGQKGRADYVLFCGLTPIAIVEAKKQNANVAGKIGQAERYSLGFKVEEPFKGAWEIEGQPKAWHDGDKSYYQIPFVYSCNGRAYVPQLEEQSGTWFRDVRRPNYIKRALPKFHSPNGLLDILKRSKEEAEKQLKQEGFGYLNLRDYQEKAVNAVEDTLAENIRIALLAMATGTGKTRTIIGLIYRFLKAERFKRILFLVDRRALGEQALDSFKEAPLEQNQPLSKIYNIAELGDMAVEAETRVQVATVQAMVKRIFSSDSPPQIDQYDCIIVDEAHRGYTLDQEMTDGELATRDTSQYLSSYRRVLEYFDAIKVGLTATPAKHTSEIFGHPVYTYSFDEAVADDWLIDYEPPIRYKTLLTQNGISFDKGEEIETIDLKTAKVEIAELEDELKFEVDTFNRQVINENFNRVICEDLVQELDPFGDEKTMIFCVNNRHADMVKRLLDEAFLDLHGKNYNQAAVEKITGESDKVEQLIRKYKNEDYPNIAITVDLLTTGIDVPKICNLVFMRRVKSRILFEQMIGRATRRCDEIGKTVFRIYDPVDLFAALEDVNTMKPLVKDPNIKLEQLVDELTDPETLTTAIKYTGDDKNDTHADVLLSQISQKIMRVLRKAQAKAENDPQLKDKLDELEQLWGVKPKILHKHLYELGPKQAAEFVKQHDGLLHQISLVKQILGSDHKPVISHHEDSITERTQSYGEHQRPEDYLASFTKFIKEQLNQSAALAAVANKPRDLTREQLKEVRLLLGGAGFSEANLQTAVRNQTNQDIAASIIGHIRRAAFGEPLVPFEQRVAQAMTRIYANHQWTKAQRSWLERLAKQLVHEVIVDREFVNQRFADKGGAKQLDKVLKNQLDNVLVEINEAIWPVQSAG